MEGLHIVKDMTTRLKDEKNWRAVSGQGVAW